jgi:hypothetical protein
MVRWSNSAFIGLAGRMYGTECQYYYYRSLVDVDVRGGR